MCLPSASFNWGAEGAKAQQMQNRHAVDGLITLITHGVRASTNGTDPYHRDGIRQSHTERAMQRTVIGSIMGVFVSLCACKANLAHICHKIVLLYTRTLSFLQVAGKPNVGHGNPVTAAPSVTTLTVVSQPHPYDRGPPLLGRETERGSLLRGPIPRAATADVHSGGVPATLREVLFRAFTSTSGNATSERDDGAYPNGLCVLRGLTTLWKQH
jgi:hypothetical protein